MRRDGRRGGCATCSVNRALLCCACANQTVPVERRQYLQELQQRRGALGARLEELLAHQAVVRGQQVELARLGEQDSAAGARATAAEKELVTCQQAASSLSALNATRRAATEQALQALGASRAEWLGGNLPTLLRYQELTHSHVSAMLLREQHAKLRHLLDILPIRINALRSGGGAPVSITIAGLKLPDSVTTPLGGWQQPEAQSAALGYVALLVDLLSTYLGGPLLHEGSFQGSTSVVWQQQSFWNRRPSSSNGVLPLYIEDGGALSSPIPNPFPSLSAKVRSTAFSWSGLQSTVKARSLDMRGGWGGGGGDRADGSGGRGSAEPDPALTRQRNADLKMGYDMLQRSVACFCRDKTLALDVKLPQGWSPFGWLVVYCTHLRKDAVRGDGEGDAAADALLADGASTDGHMHDGDEDEEEEVDGWDVVRTPFLPPPPSEPDEVEHWTRAMFTDASRRRGAGTRLSDVGRMPSALMAAVALPAAADGRLRALFARGGTVAGSL